MFGRKKGPTLPTLPFVHTDGCRIVRADPHYEPPWQEVEKGHFQRECQCWKEHVREAPADHRVRLDPLDPSTFRHAPQCEHRDTTDPALLRAILRVHDREDYWWVECSMCACCWQTPYFAAESLG